jgi:hypothetical protein
MKTIPSKIHPWLIVALVLLLPATALFAAKSVEAQ